MRPILCLFLCGSIVSPCAAEDPLRAPRPGEPVSMYRLRYQFRDGDVYRFELREKSEIVNVTSEVQLIARNDSRLDKHFRVVEVLPDGTARLELVVDRVRMRLKTGDSESIDTEQANTIEFDTASGETPPAQLEALTKRVGKPVAVARVTSTGRLLELTDQSAAKTDRVAQDLDRNNFLVALPDAPIAVGEHWSMTFDVPVNLSPQLKRNFQLRYSYKLEQVSGDLAEISFVTMLTPRLTDPVLRAQFAQQLPSGTIQFDLERGMVVSQTQRVDRTEIGIAGPRTALKIESERVEQLIDRPKSVTLTSP